MERGINITRSCCAGNELAPGHCARDECPLYSVIARAVDDSQLFINPTHSLNLAKVRSMILKGKNMGGDIK